MSGGIPTLKMQESVRRHVEACLVGYKRRRRHRELVASWMINNGFATGHGDTLEDLLKELSLAG